MSDTATKVIIPTAISLDGATTGFQPDVARFYDLASRWAEDVTLAGADTILAQEPMLANAPRRGPAKDGPLLAVVDARRRVSSWEALRECGHWSDVVALRGQGIASVDDSGRHPKRSTGQGLREIPTAGDGRVDLAEALERYRRVGG